MLESGDKVTIKGNSDKRDREARYGTVVDVTAHVPAQREMVYVRFPSGFGGWYKPERLVKCAPDKWNID